MIRSAYLCAEDPLSHYAWSGTHRRLFQALQSCSDAVALGPLQSPALSAIRFTNRVSHKLKFGEAIAHHGMISACAYARAAQQQLAIVQPEVIFAPAASVELFHLKTRLPVIYLSDATSRLLEGYYPDFTAMPAKKKRALERFEQHAIQRADALIYPSRWAAQSAIEHYGADPAKVHVLPFGPNFDDTVPAPIAKDSEHNRPLRILFVGRDWQRKGGDIAYEAVVGLRQAGIDARLIMCGCKPETAIDPTVAEIIPMIDKQKPGGYEALCALYASADLFLLPTRAECAGVVFSEAAAFGLPIVATDTGGIPTMVENGSNGVLLPLAARAADYTQTLQDIITQPGRLAAMRAASHARFASTLNWGSFARELGCIMKKLRG